MITLKTLPQATAQEVFDQIVQHLLTQLVPAQTNTTGVCRYRIEKQSGQILKCAAGCLIAEDEYKRKFEGDSWDHLVNCGLVPDTHKDLITSLQKMHDTCLVSEWPERLRQLAADYDLQYNPPQPS